MEIKDFNEEVIRLFTDKITDQVFEFIHKDAELMGEYLDLISEHDRKTVNSQLGKAIKNRFKIDNIDDNGIQKGEPECVLIKTKYTRHKLKK